MSSPLSLEKVSIPASADFLAYLLGGALRPTAPVLTGRYARRGLVETNCTIIPSPIEKKYSDADLPLYLPPHWAPYTHPEGQLYFFRSGSLRIVTECNIYDAVTRAKVAFWSKFIETKLNENEISVADTFELFIKVEDNNCDYYFVDYERQKIFWLVTVDTDDLGIGAAASPSHLDLALTGLFWSHVEYFPMHFNGLPVDIIDSLIGVFSHAIADQMTSEESTFCYSQVDCRRFLKLLKLSRQHPDDGYQVCLVARLWSVISHHRFSTHHGQTIARLGRDHAILFEIVENRRTASLVAIMSLGTAQHYSSKLDSLFIDRYVYVDQWRPVMARCVQEWKDSLLFTAVFLLFFIAHSFVRSSPYLAVGSLILFMGSLTASLMLILRHRRLEGSNSYTALEYLQSVHSDSHQFHIVALIYSLPFVLQLWGLILLGINCMFSIYLLFGIIPAVWCACFGVSSLVLSSLVLSGTTFPSLRYLFCREAKTDEDLV